MPLPAAAKLSKIHRPGRKEMEEMAQGQRKKSIPVVQHLLSRAAGAARHCSQWVERAVKNRGHRAYLKFMIGFIIVPNTATFYYLQTLIHPAAAYLISCIFWGTVIYMSTCRQKQREGELSF